LNHIHTASQPRYPHPYLLTPCISCYDIRMAKTLLQKAHASKAQVYTIKPVSLQEVQLALAWAKGDITLGQVARAYGLKPNAGSATHSKLARALRAYIQSL